MKEIEEIHAKYEGDYIAGLLAANPGADRLRLAFYRDVAEILDILSSMKNVERNPTGFSIDDAPILGLLVRTWKLLKLIVWIYDGDNAEYAIIAERSLLEAAVTAIYLLRSDQSIMEDYRRCSFRNRFKIMQQAASGSSYYKSKPGQRLLRSIKNKLALEELDETSFKTQIKNDWRLQGKSFRRIFEEVMGKDLYSVAYGTSSESVHGSWLDVRNYSMQGDVDQGFFPLYEPLHCNIDEVSRSVLFATLPFREWVKRVHLDDPYIVEVLDFIDKLNISLFNNHAELVYGV